MEELDYLIRTLTYKRSCLELDKKKQHDFTDRIYTQGKIDGLQIALNEIYKLISDSNKE